MSISFQSAALTGLLVLGSGLAQAQTCQSGSIPATTPVSQFVDNGDGTLTDTKTGLQWQRCSEGQIWDGETCSGSAELFDWQQALQRAATVNNGGGYAGQVDWRLPNIKELRSIVEKQCAAPAINSSLLPAASGFFWSSSPVASDGGSAWGVDFDDGYDYWDFKNYGNQIRLVRGGQ